MSQRPHTVIVHPLVLLSAVDHFNRIATRKRVVGVLLGEIRKGVVDVTNSFAGMLSTPLPPLYHPSTSPVPLPCTPVLYPCLVATTSTTIPFF